MKLTLDLRTEDRPFVFTVFVPLLGVCFLAAFDLFQTTWARAHWITVVLYLSPLLLPVVLYLAGHRSSFVAAAAVLIPLEILAAYLAQYTIIGLRSFLIVLFVWVNLVPVALELRSQEFGRGRWIALGLIGACILLPQGWLGPRLLRLESEAKRIVAYSYDFKIRTGDFPKDLSAYRWKHPELRGHFAFYGHGRDDKFTYPFKDDPNYDSGDRFSLRYYVGHRNTAYWFSSKNGWFVEDD